MRKSVSASSVNHSTFLTQRPVWHAVELLQNQGGWTSNQRYSPERVIVRDGRSFQIAWAVCPEQIDAGHALFTAHLALAEVETRERLHFNVRGVVLGQKLAQYRLFLATELSTRKVVAAYAGNLMDMAVDSAVFIGTYAATDESCRRLGIMREMLASALMQAAIDADRRGEQLQLIIGDCTKRSERAWNATGRRRLCIEVGRNRFREVAFKQPSIRFNLRTGAPTGDAGAVIEHLMVRTFGCEITKEMLEEAVRAVYRWCGKRTREEFASDDAFRQYCAHFDELLAEFCEGLNQGGALHLFSADERIAAEGAGCVFE